LFTTSDTIFTTLQGLDEAAVELFWQLLNNTVDHKGDNLPLKLGKIKVKIVLYLPYRTVYVTTVLYRNVIYNHSAIYAVVIALCVGRKEFVTWHLI